MQVNQERVQGQGPGLRLFRQLSWWDRGPGVNPGTLTAEHAMGCSLGGCGRTLMAKTLIFSGNIETSLKASDTQMQVE